MSDEDHDKDDQTEAPSERKLEDARKEGRIALGREIATAASLCAALGAAGPVAHHVVEGMHLALRTGANGDVRVTLLACVTPAVYAMVPIAAAALAAAAVLATQTKGELWTSLLMPRADRIWSFTRLFHLATRQGLADLGLALLKASLVVGASIHAARTALPAVLAGGHDLADPFMTVAFVGDALWPVAAAIVAGSVLDLVIVRRRFFDQMKMKKEDLKREAKEDEGDPHLRGRRRRRHRELAKGRPAVEVPRADALVVNPTHIAIAVRYRRANDRAPRVTAKGKDKQADLMRALAIKHGVPIVRDVPLARFLHKKVKVGREVPVDVYRAIATVFAYVYRITGRVPGTGPD